jgi:hypothetical protein
MTGKLFSIFFIDYYKVFFYKQNILLQELFYMIEMTLGILRGRILYNRLK